jgi:AcrR family transcriptional regulator
VETEDTDIELPRGIALAWGIAANPHRGPKRELSIEGIVEVAVEIADEGGLTAVSMSAVATRLGFTTMSLYRYVTAKDDLTLLMQEYGMGMPPLTIAESADWRSGLATWFREAIAMYAAHSWLLDVPIVSIPNTPNNLAWLDAGLTVLRDAPLTEEERVSTVLLLSGQARWQASVERSYPMTAGSGQTEQDRASARIIGSFVTEEEFPALYEAIQSGVFIDDEDDPFEFGLSRILDGLEHYMSGLRDGTVLRVRASRPEPANTYPKDEAVKRARQTRREAESKLRDARKKEQEAIVKAREREQHAAEKAAREAEKAARASSKL